jgi:hypothetical protein
MNAGPPTKVIGHRAPMWVILSLSLPKDFAFTKSSAPRMA